jgi:polycystin 1L2
VEKGDGLVDRVIPVASDSEKATFKHLFKQSIKKKLTDNHIWLSVFSRPTRSTFTRLQRLSCCMSLLFCTMIANAMFYRSEENIAAKKLITFGPLKFTATQVTVSYKIVVLSLNCVVMIK